jgi:hypothetical protein
MESDHLPPVHGELPRDCDCFLRANFFVAAGGLNRHFHFRSAAEVSNREALRSAVEDQLGERLQDHVEECAAAISAEQARRAALDGSRAETRIRCSAIWDAHCSSNSSSSAPAVARLRRLLHESAVWKPPPSSLSSSSSSSPSFSPLLSAALSPAARVLLEAVARGASTEELLRLRCPTNDGDDSDNNMKEEREEENDDDDDDDDDDDEEEENDDAMNDDCDERGATTRRGRSSSSSTSSSSSSTSSSSSSNHQQPLCLVRRAEGVFELPSFLAKAFCADLAAYVAAWSEACAGAKGRPNSMNRHGALLDEVDGGRWTALLSTPLLRDAVRPLAARLFPDDGGASLDHHRCFTVVYAVPPPPAAAAAAEEEKKYDEDQPPSGSSSSSSSSIISSSSDVALSTHFDNAEVTLNVNIAGQWGGGGELECFGNCDRPDAPRTPSVTVRFDHDEAGAAHGAQHGKAVLHRGRELHCARPILPFSSSSTSSTSSTTSTTTSTTSRSISTSTSTRTNLVLWARSSAHREAVVGCPMCGLRSGVVPLSDLLHKQQALGRS